MRSYLDFEKPVAELEAKVEELRAMESSGNAVSIGDEIQRLQLLAHDAVRFGHVLAVRSGDGLVRVLALGLGTHAQHQVAQPSDRAFHVGGRLVGKPADVVETIVREWMFRRPTKWIARAKREALFRCTRLPSASA